MWQLKQIVSLALRKLSEESDLVKADDSAYEFGFLYFQSMYEELSADGINLISPFPTSLESEIALKDLPSGLASMLAVRMQSHFSNAVGSDTLASASATHRRLKNQRSTIKRMKRPCSMPRGSANTWYTGATYYDTGEDCGC